MKLEEKLTQLRINRHLTQMELAEEMGVSRQAISRWEVGVAVPSTENLVRLSQLYAVPVDYLVNEDLDLSNLPEYPGMESIHNSASPKPQKRTFPWLKWAVAAVCIFMLGLWICTSFFSGGQLKDGTSSAIPLESLENKRLPPVPDVSFSLFP